MATKQPVVLPPNRAWTQPNTGYIFGSLYSTRNISLDVPGVLSLSKRGRYIARQDASSSSFDYLLSVAYDGQGIADTDPMYYLISSDKVFTMAQTLTGFTQDVDVGSPQCSLFSSDGLIWNDGLYVTTSNNMSKKVGGTWTGSLMSLTAGIPHPLCVSTINDYLLVGDGNLLKKRTTAGTNSTAITLPSNFRIQWIRSDNSRVLIGTRNMNGGQGSIFEWDESSGAATNKYDLDAVWSFAGEFRNTDFFTICSDGRLMKFNGGGFSEAGRLPIFKTLPGNWINNFVLGPVFQRGMRIVGGRVTVLLNGKVDDTDDDDNYFENMLSGIWEFDESTGFNHKYGLSVTQDETDFAQGVLSAGAGALGPVVIDPIDGGPDTDVGTTLLYGARLTDGDGVDWYTLGSVILSGNNRGQFETTRIETTDIADESLKLWVKFRGVFTVNDKIIFKYKDRYLQDVPFSDTAVTWTNDTTFTTTDTKWARALAGYEVTVLSGLGAGAAAHIEAITVNAGTYTVILDEAIPGVSANEDGAVLCDNYTKLETLITSTDNEAGYAQIPIPQTDPATWVQIKGEMRGSYLVTIEEAQLIDTQHVVATS